MPWLPGQLQPGDPVAQIERQVERHRHGALGRGGRDGKATEHLGCRPDGDDLGGPGCIGAGAGDGDRLAALGELGRLQQQRPLRHRIGHDLQRAQLTQSLRQSPARRSAIRIVGDPVGEPDRPRLGEAARV